MSYTMRVTILDRDMEEMSESPLGWASYASETAEDPIDMGVCLAADVGRIAAEGERKFAITFPSDGNITLVVGDKTVTIEPEDE